MFLLFLSVLLHYRIVQEYDTYIYLFSNRHVVTLHTKTTDSFYFYLSKYTIQTKYCIKCAFRSILESEQSCLHSFLFRWRMAPRPIYIYIYIPETGGTGRDSMTVRSVPSVSLIDILCYTEILQINLRLVT
jgi:hypothetical protein